MDLEASTWILGATMGIALITLVVGACRSFGQQADVTPPPLPSQRPWWKNPFIGVPTHPYHPLDLIVVALLVFLYAGPIFMGHNTEIAQTKIDASAIIGTLISQAFMIGLVGALLFWRIPLTDWLGLRQPTWKLALALAPVVVLITWTAAASLELTGFNHWLIHITETPQQQAVVSALIETENLWLLALLCFMAVIAAPISEEIIFRGYLYPVAKRFATPIPAAIFSALTFAAIHYHITALIPLALLGLLFVLVYEWTGTIWAPIAAHVLFNAATVSIQLASRFGRIDLPQP